MITIHCKICHKDIPVLGWSSHVAMEKKRWGKDIYAKIDHEPVSGPLDYFYEGLGGA